jgi:hypothetical protein
MSLNAESLFIEKSEKLIKAQVYKKCNKSTYDDVFDIIFYLTHYDVVMKLNKQIKESNDTLSTFDYFTDDEKCIYFGLNPTESNVESIYTIRKNKDTFNNLLMHQTQLIYRSLLHIENMNVEKFSCEKTTYDNIVKKLGYIDFKNKQFKWQEMLDTIIKPVIQEEFLHSKASGISKKYKKSKNKRNKKKNKKTKKK